MGKDDFWKTFRKVLQDHTVKAYNEYRRRLAGPVDHEVALRIGSRETIRHLHAMAERHEAEGKDTVADFLRECADEAFLIENARGFWRPRRRFI